MNARMRRIASDYEQIKKNFANHKNIVVEPIGEEPAEKYRVTYYVNGIYLQEDGRIETLGKHIVVVTLHAEYPRYKPICTIATPIWHPNFRDGQICIGDIWGAGESLSDIIVNIGDMIQYKSWNSFSPLSADAAEWAIANKHLFPVGNINLWTGEEEDGTPVSDFDIDLFDGDAPAEEEKPAEDKPAEEPSAEEQSPAEEPPVLAEEPTMGIFDNKGQNAAADDNDFDITADELEGIEFVPTVTRMQGSQYGATAKGGKVNFKTILTKGLLWALIGAIFAFGLQEILDKPTGSAAVLRMMGQTEMARYLETSEELNERMAYYVEKYDVESAEELFEKMSDEEQDEISALYEKNQEALMDVAEEDIPEDELEEMMKTSTRVSSALFSMLVGLALGLLLGIGEGVYYGSKENAIKYALIGMLVGAVIGFLSGFLSQVLYSSLLEETDENTSKIYMAFVRAIGWALMGAGTGVAAGLIKPEKMRILNCTLGGLIGGFIGGFIFNYISGIEALQLGPADDGILSRAIGIVVMGCLIGLGIGLLEQFAKSAWLKVIRGEFEGKEYLVFEGTTSIGNSGKNTIVLFKDKLVAPKHCEIVQEGSKYVLVDKGSPMGTVVNGMRINRHVLRQGDAIAIGNSVLVFNTK